MAPFSELRLLELFEEDDSVIYAVDGESFVVVFCNRAWDRFAHDNGGEPLERPALIGRPLLDFISGPLKDYYQEALKQASASGTEWLHSYECHSPELFRRFSMRVTPLSGTRMLLVVNSLEVERPMDLEAVAVNGGKPYEAAEGIVTMCSNCRRTRRANNGHWDWVPAFVARPPARVSHSVCRPCIVELYPTLVEKCPELLA